MSFLLCVFCPSLPCCFWHERTVILYPMDTVVCNMERHSTKLIYTKEDLLTLRKRRAAGMSHPIPRELRRKYCGCRAGARVKNGTTNSKQQRYKLSVPSILMGNVSALQNEVEKACGLDKNTEVLKGKQPDCSDGDVANQLYPRC